MKRYPSLKTLTDRLHLSPLDALTLRAAMQAGVGLACADRLLNANGVRSFTLPENSLHPKHYVEYVNRGNAYDVTLCRHNGRYVICAWGDIVERYDR